MTFDDCDDCKVAITRNIDQLLHDGGWSGPVNFEPVDLGSRTQAQYLPGIMRREITSPAVL